MSGWPDHVCVLGITYKIIYTSNMLETSHDQREPLLGQADMHARTIHVYRGTDDAPRQPMEVLETLLHEVAHAVIHSNSLLKSCIKKREEEFVDAFAAIYADSLVRSWFLAIPAKGPVKDEP